MAPKKFIRPGNKVPFHKSTFAEVEHRVAHTEGLLRAGFHAPYELKQKLMKKFGVGYRMATDYITRARERLLTRLDQVKREHRADSFAFYEGQTMNPRATPSERIRARERIDKLLGLEAPTQVEYTGNGVLTEICVDKLKLDLETKKRLLAAVREKKQKEKGKDNEAQ